MTINTEKIAQVATAITNKINSLISTHNTSTSAHNQGNANGNKNLVTDANGNIITEAKPIIPSASDTTPLADVSGGVIGSSTKWAKADHQHPLSSAYATSGHTHNNYNKATYSQTISNNTSGAYEIGKITVDGTTTTIYGKDIDTIYTHPLTHSTTIITDTNSHTNIGTSANANQGAINTAIDTAIGDLQNNLANFEIVTVVNSLGTASASTMNKLYLVAESPSKTNDAYEIYITVRSVENNEYVYAWEKVDTARIDLSDYATHDNVTSEINQALDDLAETIYPTS